MERLTKVKLVNMYLLQSIAIVDFSVVVIKTMYFNFS